MSTLTLEKLLTINNFIYFICSLVNDGGEDYRKNQEFWDNIYNNKEKISESIALVEYKFEGILGSKDKNEKKIILILIVYMIFQKKFKKLNNLKI